MKNEQQLTTTTPEEVGFSSERLTRIDNAMQQYVDENQVAGIVASVARRGKIAYFKSFGMADIDAGIEMSNDSIFRIASMSKPLTTTAVMMLYEEGRFLLNDPVSDYIPEFEDMKVMIPDANGESYTLVPATRPITIRNLLNHTSGLTYGSGLHTDYYHNDPGMYGAGLIPTEGTIGDMVIKLATIPLICQPGEEFNYSLSLDVLGYLVEVISGMSLDKFMEARLFSPLGMNDTFFTLPKEKLPRLAHLYMPNEQGVLVRPSWDSIGLDPTYLCSQSYFSGGGGLISTAGDYLKFAQMILNGGTYNGERLLSRKTIELMTTNSIADLKYTGNRDNGDTFGYGFAIRSERGMYDEIESLGVIGWDGYFNTMFWIDPKEDLIGIFMSQTNNSSTIKIPFRVLVYQAIID